MRWINYSPGEFSTPGGAPSHVDSVLAGPGKQATQVGLVARWQVIDIFIDLTDHPPPIERLTGRIGVTDERSGRIVDRQ